MTRPTRSRRRKAGFVSGFAALLGRPNAGKSTLLNRFLDTKLAIVSSKPQTTRTTIQGVLNLEQAQVIFVDTPGLHNAKSRLNRIMMDEAREALNGKDVLVFVVDSNAPFCKLDEEALSIVAMTETPVILAMNKIDHLKNKSLLLPLIEAYRSRRDFTDVLPVSALTGEGVDALQAAIISKLPKGPNWYPEGYVTDQPERFLASEIIREKVLSATVQEVPHSVAVVIDSWKRDGELLRIAGAIYVERPGQKAIIVGARGAKIKQIGTEARLELEGFLDTRIFLDLFVKVHPNWREDPAFLKELDWRSMAGIESQADE